MEAAIKNERTIKIRVLHRLLFDSPGDRSSRSKIREFDGFHFPPTSDELKNKIENTKKNFKLSEMITVANILCISNEGTLDELCTRVISSLNDIEELKKSNDDSCDDENEVLGGDSLEGNQEKNFSLRDDSGIMQTWQLPTS